MSRIGKKPVVLAKGVQITITDDNFVTVKGPKGTLSQQLHPDMIIAQEQGELTVIRPSDSKLHKSLHGLTRTLLHNMVVGVTEGWQRALEINGVGYRAVLEGQTLVLNLGFSHQVRLDPPADVQYVVGERKSANEPLALLVRGIDKQVVGEEAARIRGLRPPEPYKGKGVKYAEEKIRRKAGKAGKAK
ncbi:50S ribosomal protein L6 [Candidatus Viridilinea mediisalina]|uniref:Large ribosomal subunit protein uL6 n=1 Tax=Candidatus Viridilinea mediisalina TaxID=2024553 RepID=A0A2A6RM70_9CHLR|nr:50S ribosomal protein L6 [Candidatus Viridilinea mediisalina]PDW04194.1 50S ribosomal protein L6 [Candidatus Viridilinea mediisalina]